MAYQPSLVVLYQRHSFFVWNSLEDQIQDRRQKLVLVNQIKSSPFEDFAIPADHWQNKKKKKKRKEKAKN